jgi:hypothetical protein
MGRNISECTTPAGERRKSLIRDAKLLGRLPRVTSHTGGVPFTKKKWNKLIFRNFNPRIGGE